MQSNFQQTLQQKIDSKTKPLGALGILERLAFQIGSVQNTLSPQLIAPHLVVFAADHGLTDEGISAYPKAVTPQMVYNFINGGAAINVFCNQHNVNLKIVDAGVDHDFNDHEAIIHAKAGYGTKNSLYEEAMASSQLEYCIQSAQYIIDDIHQSGCNIIGFGEMGIGNTSASSLILSRLLNIDIEQLVGRGTGVNDQQLQHKTQILKSVLLKHQAISNHPLEVLRVFGGFEIAQMFAAMKRAVKHNMLILIDGFIATAAYSIAFLEDQDIMKHAIFCHQSDEQGHALALKALGVQPLLNLNLRVGEGTGCALAYPIIQSAVNFLNEMSSFENANVSNKS